MLPSKQNKGHSFLVYYKGMYDWVLKGEGAWFGWAHTPPPPSTLNLNLFSITVDTINGGPP